MNTITPVELMNIKERDSNIKIIDVRRKPDFDADPVLIPGATWKDPDSVKAWEVELTDRNVVIYCARGGSVSKTISDRLSQKMDVFGIEGGIAAWKASGYPVEEK